MHTVVERSYYFRASAADRQADEDQREEVRRAERIRTFRVFYIKNTEDDEADGVFAGEDRGRQRDGQVRGEFGEGC